MGQHRALPRASTASRAPYGQAWWATDLAPGFSAPRALQFELYDDGQFHEYRFVLPEHRLWRRDGGDLVRLRLDPCYGACPAELVVDYFGVESRGTHNEPGAS